jgi:hypothetical protein
MVPGQRRPRSNGPYTVRVKPAISYECAEYVVQDFSTNAVSRPYSIEDANYLREWLTLRAAGYPLERRAC